MEKKLKRALKNIESSTDNLEYYITNLLMSKDENFIQTILTAYLNKEAGLDHLFLNETEINFINGNLQEQLTSGHIDLIEVKKGKVKNIVEIKIAYCKEFFKNGKLREEILKTVPSGIRRKDVGIINDIVTRDNTEYDVSGLYILKDVKKEEDFQGERLAVKYSDLIQSEHISDFDIEKITELLEQAIREEKKEYKKLKGYKVCNIGKINFGSFKGYSLKLHFYLIKK